MSTTPLLQAYKLLPHPAPFSVVKFEAREAFSELYRDEIGFTCPAAGLPMDQVLGRPAEFAIDPVDPATDYLRRMFGDGVAGSGIQTALRYRNSFKFPNDTLDDHHVAVFDYEDHDATENGTLEASVASASIDKDN